MCYSVDLKWMWMGTSLHNFFEPLTTHIRTSRKKLRYNYGRVTSAVKMTELLVQKLNKGVGGLLQTPEQQNRAGIFVYKGISCDFVTRSWAYGQNIQKCV